MIGQGSPFSLFRTNSFIRITSVLAMLGLLCCFARCSHGQSELAVSSSKDSIRLRISWGGGDNRRWSGTLSVNNGTLSDASALGLTSDATGSVVNSDGQLHVNHWTSTNYGGVDTTLKFTADTQLKIELSSKEEPDQRLSETIDVSELLSGTLIRELDSSGNRFSVTRVPGDLLPVTFNRDHLVFSPGEIFEVGVGVNRTELASRSSNCRLKLTSVGERNNNPTWNETLAFRTDDDGSADVQIAQVPIPVEEGVYNLHIELEPTWQQAAFRSKTDVTRTIQFVVIGNQPVAAGKKTDWQLISTIDPTIARQEKTLPFAQLSKLTSAVERKTLGNDLRRTSIIDQQPMLELLPGGWQALPLKFDRLDRPHKIEIEFLADHPTSIGISLIQADASGQVPLYGFDTGVVIPDSIVEIQRQSDGRFRHRHKMVCWPRDKQPYLLLANRHATQTATIGTIQIFNDPGRLPTAAGLPLATFNDGPPSKNNRSTTVAKRKFMAFYESPLFPENFGATESIDPLVGQPLDDWQMFYDGADRLVQYLKANSYSGAFITVACDGSAIYPSRILGASPKHDSGTFFSNGQDPIRKDVLEMLFRMFEREGLTLVPAMALSGPLPDLEESRWLARNKEPFDMLDYNRSSASRTLKSHLPVYNPLNRQVQKNVTDVVKEISQRYRSHKCFEGLALVCRPDTFTLLPGRQWGYDSATTLQFLQAQNGIAEIPQKWNDIQQILLGTHQEAWVNWRAQQMSLWYRSILEELRRSVPAGSLYIAPVDLYANDEMNAAFSPSIHGSVDFRRNMLQMGFDATFLAQTPGLKLLKPQRFSPSQSLAANRVEINLAHNRQVDEFYQQAQSPGDIFSHRVSWAQFAQLQEQNPFKQQKTPILRLQQLTPGADWNRQRFLNSLRTSDTKTLIDGGWTLPLGQESDLDDLVRVFCSLPDLPFANVQPLDWPNKIAPSSLPVAVRQHTSSGETYFYAINASPWPVKIKLPLRTERSLQNLVIDSLKAQSDSTTDFVMVLENGVPKIEMELPALSMTGGFSSQVFEITSYQFALPKNAADRLRKHVYALQAKLVESTKLPPLKMLENPDFELGEQEAIRGWDLGQQSTENIRLESNQSYHGQMCLTMNSDHNQPVWIRSNTIEPAETGRISISVWLRTDFPNQQPPLRLAIEGKLGESSYYRFGSVGSLSPHNQTNQLSEQWQRFVVHFDDLPLERLTNLRIGFDLMGSGQVQLDNVEVFDRWFDEHDAKAITQRLASCGPLLANPATFESCRLLLEGYWPRFLNEYFGDRPHHETTAAETNADSSDDAQTKSLFRRFRRIGNNRKQSIR